MVITTTPRPIPLIKELIHRKDGSVSVTSGSIFDNEANLSETALTELRIRWEGTRLAKQELYGELLEDSQGALWTREVLDRTRLDILNMPDFRDLLRVAI